MGLSCKGLVTVTGGKLTTFRRLAWGNKRWKEEITTYLEHWNHSHALPIQRTTPKRIKNLTPLAAVGQWFNRIATKIWPKRWGG
jgi:glycerol-3-phosphate dehydrogenase